MKKKLILTAVAALSLGIVVTGCKKNTTTNKVTTTSKVTTTNRVTTAQKTTAHTHAYGEWQIVKDSTCLEDGSKKKECTCGDIITEKIGSKGHDYSNDGTCKRDGCDLELVEEELDNPFEEINTLEDSYYKLSLKAGTYNITSNNDSKFILSNSEFETITNELDEEFILEADSEVYLVAIGETNLKINHIDHNYSNKTGICSICLEESATLLEYGDKVNFATNYEEYEHFKFVAKSDMVQIVHEKNSNIDIFVYDSNLTEIKPLTYSYNYKTPFYNLTIDEIYYISFTGKNSSDTPIENKVMVDVIPELTLDNKIITDDSFSWMYFKIAPQDRTWALVFNDYSKFNYSIYKHTIGDNSLGGQVYDGLYSSDTCEYYVFLSSVRASDEEIGLFVLPEYDEIEVFNALETFTPQKRYKFKDKEYFIFGLENLDEINTPGIYTKNLEDDWSNISKNYLICSDTKGYVTYSIQVSPQIIGDYYSDVNRYIVWKASDNQEFRVEHTCERTIKDGKAGYCEYCDDTEIHQLNTSLVAYDHVPIWYEFTAEYSNVRVVGLPSGSLYLYDEDFNEIDRVKFNWDPLSYDYTLETGKKYYIMIKSVSNKNVYMRVQEWS